MTRSVSQKQTFATVTDTVSTIPTQSISRFSIKAAFKSSVSCVAKIHEMRFEYGISQLTSSPA